MKKQYTITVQSLGLFLTFNFKNINSTINHFTSSKKSENVNKKQKSYPFMIYLLC